MYCENACVGLFFCVDGKFFFYKCLLSEAESYGDFLNYPASHDAVWRRNHAQKYHVDFDYYPRGRVVYRKSDGIFLIYYDRCIEKGIGEILAYYAGQDVKLQTDEHYQCHRCNKYYVK